MFTNVQRAGRYFAEGRRNGQTIAQALDYARIFVKEHGPKNGAPAHTFTDGEIIAGRCDCPGCDVRRGV